MVKARVYDNSIYGIEKKQFPYKDKLAGIDCRKKEAMLQLVSEDFFEYFQLWKSVSEEPA